MVVVKIASEKNRTMGDGVPRDSALPKRMSQNSATASTSNACGETSTVHVDARSYLFCKTQTQTHLNTRVPTHTTSTDGPCQAGIAAKTENLCSPSHPSKHENNTVNFGGVHTPHTLTDQALVK